MSLTEWPTYHDNLITLYHACSNIKHKIYFNTIMYYICFSITANILVHVITFVELCLTLKGTHMTEDRTEIN